MRHVIWVMDSLLSFCSSVGKSLWCETNSLLISSCVAKWAPSWDQRDNIRLWWKFFMSSWWKKWLLCSPSLRYYTRDLWHKRVSYFFWRASNYSINIPSSATIYSLQASRIIWYCKASIWSSNFLFSLNLSPNSTLFHFLIHSFNSFSLCYRDCIYELQWPHYHSTNPSTSPENSDVRTKIFQRRMGDDEVIISNQSLSIWASDPNLCLVEFTVPQKGPWPIDPQRGGNDQVYKEYGFYLLFSFFNFVFHLLCCYSLASGLESGLGKW